MSWDRKNESNLIEDYKNGLSWIELQSKYDCSVTTVHDVLAKHNITKYRREAKKWSKEKDKLFTEMYMSNCPYPEICKVFGIKSSTVTAAVHRLGLEMRGSGRKNTFANKFADNTIESNYWLGYIFADGHIAMKTRSGSISLYSEKKYVIDKFVEWFGPGVRIYSKEYTTKNGERKTMYQASIGSKKLASWMIDVIGLQQNKHHTLNPNITIDWDVFRGYFDGDGSMSEHKYLSIKSCSKVWLDRLHDFLLNNGIKSSIKLSYRDCYGLFVYDKKNLSLVLEKMYEHDYYCHEYKHQNLVNRVAEMQHRKSGELLEA